MGLEFKLSLLDRIYNLYGRFAAGLTVACKRHCSHCCTCNVTLTTLEGYAIVRQMIGSGQSSLLDRLPDLPSNGRFQPRMTTNMLADLCAAGQDPLEEEIAGDCGVCPMLDDAECPIYGMRPFGCRCFVSRRSCGEIGYADVDPFVLSVNTVFLQFIEHVDSKGCSGNFIDVLGAMQTEARRRQYRHDRLDPATYGLVANRPMRVLFVPPEHRTRIKPMVSSLQRITFQASTAPRRSIRRSGPCRPV